jgi:hypothetical protein
MRQIMQTQQSLSQRMQEPVMKESEKQSQDDTEQKSNSRDVERRLFAGLMRTKTLPMVPDQTPSNIPVEPDAPETSKQNSQPSFAASSKGLLSLKQKLLARGMSDEKAEAYLRQL